MLPQATLELGKFALNTLAEQIYHANVKAGWYTNPKTRRRIERNPMEMLMLIVTEISEGAEGFRKDLQDNHLPEFSMLTVELADAIIRICDLAGYLNLPIGDALAAKLIYNAHREDHKLSARAEANGKKF